ncbi:DUF2591 domain-containing protein [Salmonella enterica]|nr:DUF2591 domain-containing protein [Salmonella enterica]ELE3132484.1 DUF2591 domain-containing protein [Salmonella enterica]ELF0568350.1 DUF2591 domain-containing protein [Salmonella enterica]ELO2079110.1 DUF2591 domain-containing protein [Salmonella enterica]ELO2809507.1 DUF2591 domain-containing protein [Salmonella enterica]
MKNYSEMTDFEINCLVAEATDQRPLISQYGWKGSQEGDYKAVIAIGPNGAGSFDWCNDPVDAWDIISKNRIGVIPAKQSGEWRAAHRKVDDSTPQHLIQNSNPFRAAMIVFLLMQEKKNEKTV